MTEQKTVNDTESSAIDLLLSGNTQQDTALSLGLSHYRLVSLLKKPHVQAELSARVTHRLKAGAALAVHVMESVMLDTKATPKTRLDAAKAIMDRAGFTPKTDAASGPGDLGALTNEQLHALADKITNEKGDRAVTVDGEAKQIASD